MITREAAGSTRTSEIASLRADNARLHRLAMELEIDVRELRAAVGMRQSRPAVERVPQFDRLLPASVGLRRAQPESK